MENGMRLGVAATLRLTRWAWFHTGIDRRLIGLDEEAGVWVSTAAIVAIGTSAPGKPPTWATTADHREVLLSAPAQELSDEMLGAVDELHASHPFFQIQAKATVTIRLWHPKPVMLKLDALKSA
jgi:hypothetical protein